MALLLPRATQAFKDNGRSSFDGSKATAVTPARVRSELVPRLNQKLLRLLQHRGVTVTDGLAFHIEEVLKQSTLVESFVELLGAFSMEQKLESFRLSQVRSLRNRAHDLKKTSGGRGTENQKLRSDVEAHEAFVRHRATSIESARTKLAEKYDESLKSLLQTLSSVLSHDPPDVYRQPLSDELLHIKPQFEPIHPAGLELALNRPHGQLLVGELAKRRSHKFHVTGAQIVFLDSANTPWTKGLLLSRGLTEKHELILYPKEGPPLLVLLDKEGRSRYTQEVFHVETLSEAKAEAEAKGWQVIFRNGTPWAFFDPSHGLMAVKADNRELTGRMSDEVVPARIHFRRVVPKTPRMPVGSYIHDLVNSDDSNSTEEVRVGAYTADQKFIEFASKAGASDDSFSAFHEWSSDRPSVDTHLVDQNGQVRVGWGNQGAKMAWSPVFLVSYEAANRPLITRDRMARYQMLFADSARTIEAWEALLRGLDPSTPRDEVSKLLSGAVPWDLNRFR